MNILKGTGSLISSLLAVIALGFGSLYAPAHPLDVYHPSEESRALSPVSLAPTCRIILHHQQRLYLRLRREADQTANRPVSAVLLAQSRQAAEDYNRVARTSDAFVFSPAALPHSLPER